MLQLIVSDRVFHGCDKFNSFVGDIIFVSKRMLKLVSRPEYYLKPSMCPVHLSTIFFLSWESNLCGVCDSCTLSFFSIDSFGSRKIGSSLLIFARQVI